MWEYKRLAFLTNSINEDFILPLNAAGTLGWEAVGITAADPTLGFNQIVVLLKRPIPAWPAPPTSEAAWHSDPTGRFATRYWDGIRWSEHVSDGTTQTTDFPNRR